jgi:hypothetical protein
VIAMDVVARSAMLAVKLGPFTIDPRTMPSEQSRRLPFGRKRPSIVAI